MDLIKEIHRYLAAEINDVNTNIVKCLNVEEELIHTISMHLSNAGGKRIRPVLTILSARMLGYQGKNAIKLATAVEFIHMATLLHDDVVDGSKMRRFLPTANTIWGSKASILVGDFLFSQSFKLMVSTHLMPALEVLSSASNIIAQGEVSQLTQLEKKKIISEQEYLKVINAKTAELFGAACKVGSIVAEKNNIADKLYSYGICLGNIFQISDDLLDYFSQSTEVGKNIGEDFYEGKVTLPIIMLNQVLIHQDQLKLESLIAATQRTPDDFNWVKSKMLEHNIADSICNYLNGIKLKALEHLESIDYISDNKAKQHLEKLVDFAVNRTY
ncbi:MAG: polyprenyl synthetase family protein [Rickettsiaceae bacterium]